MNIGVIGAGYVGLVTGVCFAHLGHHVVCVDNDPRKLKLLNRQKSPIYEPGLEELLKANVAATRLEFTDSIARAVEKCEVLFICVNTPPLENGEADLSFVETVSKTIAKNIRSYRLIVSKSTVPVQTGEWVYSTIKKELKKPALFDVASNPEFLREGSAVNDFLNPDRIVLGVSNSRSEKMLKRVYEPISAPVVITDIKSAELIKHACNSFLASKISFINMVARICDAVGADVEMVAQGMGLDPRISPSFLKAGIGFGGFCFPKDLSSFLRISEKLGVRFGLLQETLDINSTQKQFFVELIRRKLFGLKGKKLALFGLAFKPDTDDMRYAPSIDIIEALQNMGASVAAYDPQAMDKSRSIFKKVKFGKNPYDIAKGADAAVIITEWKEFKNLNWKKIRRNLKTPNLFDGRNMLNPEEMRSYGFDYWGIGRR